MWKKLCSINCLPSSLFTCQPHPESRFPGVGHGHGCIQDPLIQLPYPKSNGLIPSLTCQSTIYIIIYLSRWPEMEFQSTTGCTRSFLESQRCWQTWTRSALWQMDGVDGGISKNKDVLSVGLCVWLPRHCFTLGKSHFPLLHPAAPVAGDLGPRVAHRPLYPSFIPLPLGTC